MGSACPLDGSRHAGGGILLLSTFWQTFSRVCLTDVPASSFAALALAGVAFDAQLVHRRTRVLFGVMGAASVLSKSAAGMLPFAALILFCVLTSRANRAKFANVAESVLIAGVLVAPWYVYQAAVHPEWLWSDYFKTQLISTGLHWDRNSIVRDSHIVYYLRRLIEMDSAVLALAAVGLAGGLRIVRLRRSPATLLAACWVAVAVAALCAFQAANLPYVALVLPSLCVFGAVCGPGFVDRRPAITACVLGILFFAKIAVSGQPWSLRPTAPPLTGAKAMREYYDLNRDAELISIDPDDEFYSLTIPLPRVRYCVLDPTGVLQRYVPHYLPLGIIVTSDQFINLPRLVPQFEKQLHTWGVDSQEPIGTTITMSAPSEVSDLVNARPESDFYLPVRWLDVIDGPERAHQLVRYSSERIFLLSRAAKPRAQPVPVIPLHW